MDYKETVMQLEEMHGAIEGIDVVSCSYEEALNLKKVAYAQAEISFKAGQEEERKDGTNSIAYLEGLQEGTKQARKEVVDWLLGEGGFPWSMDEYPERIKVWRDKLKEWGLDK